MIKTKFGILITMIGLLSCRESRNEATNNYSMVEISEDNSTPTVDISEYTLIDDSQNDRRTDAKEILNVKRKWPLAMQSLDPSAFDSILSRNFTFKGGTEFFNREDYIKNRTTPDDWKITFVEYDNVTLQFFGNTAVLSYKNRVRNENKVTGEIEIDHISWVDVYIREDEKWKLEATHSIDYISEAIGSGLKTE